MTKNQRSERAYFELFAKLYPLPDGEVSYADKPDIVIEGSDKLGIEITQFHIKDGSCTDSEQRQRKMREGVVEEAQRLYFENTHNPRPELTYSFNNEHPITQPKLLAKTIVELVAKCDLSREGEILRDQFTEIKELKSIWVNPTEYEDSKWRICQVYPGEIMSPQRIEIEIRKKEKKTKNYIPCDRYWLLIVVNFFDQATDQELPENVKIQSNIFEKIILWRTALNEIVMAQGG